MPPQLRRPALHDFRAAPTNQRGFLMKNKRKLDDYAAQVTVGRVGSSLIPRQTFRVPTKALNDKPYKSAPSLCCLSSAAAG